MTHPSNGVLAELSTAVPSTLDLTDPGHLRSVRDAAEGIEAAYPSAALLADLEAEVGGSPDGPIGLPVALKLALSRRMLQEVAEPLHVSVTFAVYKEHQRILPSSEHSNGEDFLREKLRQLRWLFEPAPQHSWDLTVVDDGCPEGSGHLARAIFDDYATPDEDVRVIFLQEAIAEGIPVTRDLASTADSQKGGSVRLGFWSSLQRPRPGTHVLLFTDADLSTHLGQTGLLAAPLASEDACAAIGSRREPASVVVKTGTRNVRGKLFIYLWKRLLPQLGHVVDTQCGFKAFRADHVAGWIEDTVENRFAFDIEFLLRVQLDRPGSIVKVPVAWIDSEAESTTTDLEPYLPMLRSVVGFYRRMLPAESAADSFASLLDALDDDGFHRLVADVPPSIADRDPAEFTQFDAVSAEDLAVLARG